MLGQHCEKRHDMSTTPATTRGSAIQPLTLLLLTAVLVLTAGCSSGPSIKTEAPAPGAFHEHALTQRDARLRVTVAVLSDEEAKAELGMDLGRRWLQAIWIEVENHDSVPYWVLMPSLDPNYFATDEVAYALRDQLVDN